MSTAYIDAIKVEAETGLDGSRYSGGANRTVSDHPYVKGYFYVFFGLPSTLFGGAAGGITAERAMKYLLVSAEAYTPPGDRTINVQDIQGQGGVDASFITGQTITREFSIQYKDYWGAPIFRIHRQWTSYINPYLGGSIFAKDFSSTEYKGACMVIQTKPLARGTGAKDTWKKEDIIKVDYFDGVQPITDIKSAFDANVTDNSFVKPTVQYKFDGYPLDETNADVLTKAVTVMNSQQHFEKVGALYEALGQGGADQIVISGGTGGTTPAKS